MKGIRTGVGSAGGSAGGTAVGSTGAVTVKATLVSADSLPEANAPTSYDPSRSSGEVVVKVPSSAAVTVPQSAGVPPCKVAVRTYSPAGKPVPLIVAISPVR